MDSLGLIIAAATLLLSLVFAQIRRSRDGRFRETPRNTSSEALSTIADGRLTFVQFSGEICSQCRTNERIFSQTLEKHPNVQFTDVPAEQHMELVRDLGIMRSPTVLLVEPSGEIVARAQGVVTKQTILELIGTHND